MKRLQTIIFIAVAIALTGCGGPRYKKQFQEWVGFEIAQNAPVRLTSVSVSNEISRGTETMFDFTGTIEITEDLYSVVSVIDQTLLNQGNSRAQQAKVDGGKFNEIKAATVEQIADVTLVERTAKRGQKLEVSGKAVGQKTGEKTWEFAIREIRGGDLKGGKPPNGTWFEVGTSDAKKHIADAEAKIAAFAKAVEELATTTEAGRAEETARIAEENRKRHEAYLAAWAPGTTWKGVWETADARGNIGIIFNIQTAKGNEYYVQGHLFDPENPNHSKPFLGTVTGNQFKLNVKAGEGGVKVDASLNRLGRDKVKQAGLADKTVSILFEECHYPIELVLSSDFTELSGRIAAFGGGTRYWTSKPYPKFYLKADTTATPQIQPVQSEPQGLIEVAPQDSTSSTGGNSAVPESTGSIRDSNLVLIKAGEENGKTQVMIWDRTKKALVDKMVYDLDNPQIGQTVKTPYGVAVYVADGRTDLLKQ